MPANPPPTNPYSNAATTYGDHAQKSTSDPREIEARVLLKAANMMQDLQANWSPDNLTQIDEALKYNRQIWMIFFDTAIENKDGNRPIELRNNIVNLANFVFKRTVDIMANPEKSKFDVLITINRDIAAGLMNQTAQQRGDSRSVSSQTTTSA